MFEKKVVAFTNAIIHLEEKATFVLTDNRDKRQKKSKKYRKSAEAFASMGLEVQIHPAQMNSSFDENHIVQVAKMFISSDNFPLQTFSST